MIPVIFGGAHASKTNNKAETFDIRFAIVGVVINEISFSLGIVRNLCVAIYVPKSTRR